MPQRKKTQIYNGERYVTRCEKDQRAREDVIKKNDFREKLTNRQAECIIF